MIGLILVCRKIPAYMLGRALPLLALGALELGLESHILKLIVRAI